MKYTNDDYPDHDWKVINRDDNSITYAATFGDDVIVRTVTGVSVSGPFFTTTFTPHSESSVVLLNRKIQDFQENYGTEKQKTVWRVVER